MANNLRPKLYRHYNEYDELLYVGVSTSICARLAAHRSNSHWFDQIVFIKIENFNTKEEMLLAEAKAIKEEKPLFNRILAEKTKLTAKSLLGIPELSVYLGIPQGRIRREIQLNRFLLKPETEHPFKWMKWKIDVHVNNSEIKTYLDGLRS